MNRKPTIGYLKTKILGQADIIGVPKSETIMRKNLYKEMLEKEINGKYIDYPDDFDFDEYEKYKKKVLSGRKSSTNQHNQNLQNKETVEKQGKTIVHLKEYIDMLVRQCKQNEKDRTLVMNNTMRASNEILQKLQKELEEKNAEITKLKEELKNKEHTHVPVSCIFKVGNETVEFETFEVIV